MKAQSSTEFVLLIGFVLMIVAVFLVVIQARMYDSIRADGDERAAQIEQIILNEALLAMQAPDGYQRVFFIPPTIQGQIYDLYRVDDREAVIMYHGEERVVFLPKNVTLENITRGYNIISRGNGLIRIEDASGIACLDVDGDEYNGSGITCDPMSPWYDCMEQDANGVESMAVHRDASEDSPSACANGADDDCDFYIDCYDTDCRETESCSISSLVVYDMNAQSCTEGDCIQVHAMGTSLALDAGKSVGSFVTPLLDATNITQWQRVQWNAQYTLPDALPITPNMQVYYAFNTTMPLRDASGHGYDLTNNGGAVLLSTGLAGGSYNFKTWLGHLSYAGPGPGAPMTNFTVEALVFYQNAIPAPKPPPNIRSYAGIIQMRNRWRLMVEEHNYSTQYPRLFYQYQDPLDSTWKNVTSTHSLKRNAWNHIAVSVQDGVEQTVRFYVNGQLSERTISRKPTAAGGAIIAGGGQLTNYTLNGTLDELVVWNQVLAQSNISEHISAYTSMLRFQVCAAVLPTDCVLSYEFTGPDGTHATYYTGSDDTVFDISHLHASQYLRVRFIFLNTVGGGTPLVFNMNATGLIVG